MRIEIRIPERVDMTMKKKTFFYVTLLLALVVSLTSVASAPVQAQQNDLDTILARAAAKADGSTPLNAKASRRTPSARPTPRDTLRTALLPITA